MKSLPFSGGQTLVRTMHSTREYRKSQWVMRWAFAALLLLSFVGLQPFTYENWLVEAAAGAGEGDTARQISYATLFIVIGGLGFLTKGPRVMRTVPAMLLLLLLWCLVSTLWSVAPDVTLRRAVLTAMVSCAVFWAVDMLGVERSLRVLYLVVVAVLVVNLVSIAVLPEASHSAGDSDSSLVGAWRGLHPHKNSAAGISALSALLFFHHSLRSGRIIHWIFFLAAVVFTLGTQSKTSIGMMAFALVAMIAYAQSQSNLRGRRRFRKLIFGSSFLFALAMLFFQEWIVEIFLDESSFTGRGLVWFMLLSYASDHPTLGSGFGAFWNSGDASPVLSLALNEVMLRYKQSHNGYLQLLVEIGGVGLVLAMFTLVLLPLKRLLHARHGLGVHMSLCFSWMVFCLGLNFTEAQLLSRDAPSWMFMLICLAILHQHRLHSPNLRLNGGRATENVVMTAHARSAV